MADMINHPSHYTFGAIEVISYIDGLGIGYEYARGNAIKYIARADHKGRRLEDLQKARWYIQHMIDSIDVEGHSCPLSGISTESVITDWGLGKNLAIALHGVAMGTRSSLLTALSYLDHEIGKEEEVANERPAQD